MATDIATTWRRLIRAAPRAKLSVLLRAVVSMLVVACATRVLAAPFLPANEAEPPTGQYAPPPRNDPPRWRFRAMLATGAGGGLSGVRTSVFPTQLELGARMWGPLSLTLGGTALISSREVVHCGEPVRANAVLGSLGLRADLRNSKSASWIDPFLEVHASVAGQTGFAESSEPCGGPRVLASGGAKIGIDAWLGRVAITAQLSYEYLPVAAPLAVSLGASFILR